MNPVAQVLSRKYLLAACAVAVVAVGAVAFSALFARASTGPAVITTVTNPANAVVTSAPVGTNLVAGATVSSSTTSVAPTGTVTYNTYANQFCTGSPTVQSGVALVNGMASSSATLMPATGLSYIINYNGDASNTPSVSGCVAIAPTSGNVTLATGLSATNVLVGSSVTANATLAGVTSIATGTVAYNFYTNNTCSAATTSPASVVVANGVVPTSAATTFNVPGTYYLQAVYSGDQSNAATTTACGSSVLNVSAVAPTTGTITIDEVTNPAASSTNFQFNTTGTGYSSFSLTDTAAPNVQTLTPGAYTVSQTAVPGWNLTGASCSVNGSTGGSYTPGSTLNLTAGGSIICTFTDTANTVTPPTIGPGTISGNVFNDVNKNDVNDSGDANLAGWTVWLHTGSNYNGPIVATAVTDANGNYSFTNLGSGTYFVEEQEQSGWAQTTNDSAVTLSPNTLSAVVNFANTQSATSTGTGNQHNGKGKHTHQANCNGKNNTASTTPPVKHVDNDNDNDDNNASTTNNGNHYGWMNGITHGLKLGWFKHGKGN